ncbi:hypothetical protein BMI86_10295 [Thioclava sp. DLFJ5-1]|uniref:hypothetical protein n=1 Tax=Thioclava sp. DLFJ5-1 TaxID=1915314 RepID=UPI0009987E66|nr:hypothetical protein [Thioclava sp. DLFJ5-1]OOY20887.1 hypothetical protein BMI86_10295 [Thioclava sp. DLFJ5-1]
MKVDIKGFGGEQPRVDPYYLPDTAAVTARDARLTRGTIAPMKGGKQVTVLPVTPGSKLGAIYLHNGEWFSWYQPVKCAPGPVATDRLYISRTSDIPQMFTGYHEIQLKLPNPTGAPGAAHEDSEPVDPDIAVWVSYCYTFVTNLNEETGPGANSNPLRWNEGVQINLTFQPTAPQIGARDKMYRRIYRSETSASGITDFYLVAEIDPFLTSWSDLYGDNPIMEALPTKHYEPAPDDLRQITALPNGMMAGFSGRDIMFCEPYIPSAWPPDYALTLTDDPVALVATGTSLVVLTNGQPYIIQGTTPDAMTMSKVEVTFPCVSVLSAVDMGYAAIYASPHGLVKISESGAQLISEKIWDQDAWDAIDHASIAAARWGDQYIFTYDLVDGGRELAILNPTDQPTLVKSSISARALYTANDGTLYFLDDDGQTVYEWHAGAPMPYEWKSKPFRFNAATGFSAIYLKTLARKAPKFQPDGAHVIVQERAIAVLGGVDVASQSSDDVTLEVDAATLKSDGADSVTLDFNPVSGDDFKLEVYGDGELIVTHDKGAGKLLRVPAGEYYDWQLRVTGTAEILNIAIGQSAREVGP